MNESETMTERAYPLEAPPQGAPAAQASPSPSALRWSFEGLPALVDAEVVALIYPPPHMVTEEPFRVVKVRPDALVEAFGDAKGITVTGRFQALAVGLHVQIRGIFKTHPTRGRQIAAESVTERSPVTLRQWEKYLLFLEVPGLGERTAAALVARFGLELYDVVETAPDKLLEVKGVTREIVEGLVQRWGSKKADRAASRHKADAIVFLGSLLESDGEGGQQSILDRAQIREIVAHYKTEAVVLASTNPWRFALEVHGVSFETADKIAEALHVPFDSLDRARAGIRQILTQDVDRGHTYIEAWRLLQQALHLLDQGDGDPSETSKLKRRLIEATKSFAEFDANEVGGKGAYLTIETFGTPVQQVVYQTTWLRREKRVAESFARVLGAKAETPRAGGASPAGRPVGEEISAEPLLLASPQVKPVRLEDSLSLFESELTFKLNAIQREAITLASTAKGMVLTGGPGTGKTTIIQGMLRVFQGFGLSVRLAAPTGRAAKRMQDVCGHQASTIHRLLGVHAEEDGRGKMQFSFLHDENNPIHGHCECGQRDEENNVILDRAAKPVDVLILDEVSMVDLKLFDSLLRAVASTTRLILVGDVDQLPSVDAGTVLADVIGSGACPVVRLLEIVRQGKGKGGEESDIVIGAHALNRGEVPEWNPSPTSELRLVETSDDPKEVRERLLELLQTLPYDMRTEIQIMTPVHKGHVGTRELNKAIQEILNPKPFDTEPEWNGFRAGDRVMQTKNDYASGAMNGHVGKILSLDVSQTPRTLTVLFDDLERPVTYTTISTLAHAYAFTVHKSQGNEYPVVLLPVLKAFYYMSRKLLYTAVTRGKKLVVLVGREEAIRKALNLSEYRRSRLADRIRETMWRENETAQAAGASPAGRLERGEEL